MRLLNVNTLVICEFIGSDVPPYAILSHTWGEQEVSFKDMVKRRAAGIKGYQKILGCCEQARINGFEYVWIDTCCIDKQSSAEVSEAINSMYRWYQEAKVCYAYLEDVSKDDIKEVIEDDAEDADPTFRSHFDWERIKNQVPCGFRLSRWFTRGWTLQELIAPPFVVFYSKEWLELGTRNTLKNALGAITGIRTKALNGRFLKEFSVAKKMSVSTPLNLAKVFLYTVRQK